MIITEIKKLKKKCKPVKKVSRGLQIGDRLLKSLRQHESGVGLAANQIGIDARVCVINVNKPIILVNPTIIGKFGKILFQEGCLSFPGDYILTERYANIAVNAENHDTTLFFSADTDILECVCVQHEIDHLDGIVMYDRKGEYDGQQNFQKEGS
jgi:peptide deformylase